MRCRVAVISLFLLGCAGRAAEPGKPPAPAPPAHQPTHAAPIDEPLPSPVAEQVLVELSVVHTASEFHGPIALPTTMPADAMLLTRLRTLATLGKPFLSDASVQETNVRLSGTIMQLDTDRWRASVSYIERFGLSHRHITTRILVTEDEPRIIGRLLGSEGHDLLVLTIRRPN